LTNWTSSPDLVLVLHGVHLIVTAPSKKIVELE